MIRSSISNLAIVCSLATAFAFAGCSSSDAPPSGSGDTGSVSLQLQLSNGAEIAIVEWVITRPGMEPMSGTIDTRAPGATASIEVYGLEPGGGYQIDMTAQATDEQTACRGATDFSVTADQSTEIMVILNCKSPARFGAVRANGEFNICTELTKMVVSPLQTSVGNTIDLFAAGEDAEDDEIAFLWAAEGGVVDANTAPEATFTCVDVGVGSVTVTVSDDDFDYCTSSWTVPVTCVGALVRVAHLAPEIPTADDTAVDIFINGELSPIQGLTYAMATPFVPLPAGDYEFGIAPAGGEPIFSFSAALSEGSITTVVAIRTVNSDGPENPVNVLAFDGDVSGLDEGDGAVSVGHGFDEPAVATVDGIDTNMCPPAVFPNLMFGTVQGPEPLALGPYSAALAVPNSCEVLPGTNPALLPVFDGTATLVIAVDLDVTEGAIDPAAYALVGDASGEIPLLPAVVCTIDDDCGVDEICVANECLELEYAQDFEDPPIVQQDPDTLANDGWVVFANVFNPDGSYDRGYGGPAPNAGAPDGGQGFCGIDIGQGGPTQGDQQLVIFSDYNNPDQGNGSRIEANTYRERAITLDDVGRTVTFSFDVKRGNINNPEDESCMITPSPPCDSTAFAFIKTLDPGDEFTTTNFVMEDTTEVPDLWGRLSLELTIDAGLVGQLLQVGFAATAANFEASGVFYDNVVVAKSLGGGG